MFFKYGTKRQAIPLVHYYYYFHSNADLNHGFAISSIVIPVYWLVILSLFHVKTRLFVAKVQATLPNSTSNGVSSTLSLSSVSVSDVHLTQVISSGFWIPASRWRSIQKRWRSLTWSILQSTKALGSTKSASAPKLQMTICREMTCGPQCFYYVAGLEVCHYYSEMSFRWYDSKIYQYGHWWDMFICTFSSHWFKYKAYDIYTFVQPSDAFP